MWGDPQYHSWGWMLFGGIHMIIFWLLLILLIAALLKWLRSPSDNAAGTPRDEALEILKQRFARGEIDQDTFRRMKQELEHRGP